jgi:amino acid transporter
MAVFSPRHRSVSREGREEAVPNHNTGNPEPEAGYRTTGLRANELGLSAVIMQGVTHIAPAVGVVLSIQYITSLSGVTTPLSYLFAFFIVLLLGASLTQLAKYLPSAGGYYTYLSRTVHPRAGFLTAWLYFLYDPTCPAINLAFMGFFFESTLKAEWGITWFKWWLFFLIGTAFVTFFIYRGIKISTRTVVILGLTEIAIVVALGICGLFSPGPGGVNFSSYDPGHALTTNGLFLGVVFSIFSFTGFEAVAPLAEESRNPRKSLPRGIMYSILIMGAFYLFGSWAIVLGWGTDRIPSFINSAENPVFVLAKHLWGGAWVLIFLAVINSIFAVSIACSNAATRVFYRMAETGSLPKSLAKVHPKYGTPVNAVLLMTFLTLAIGLGLGFWIGPNQEFFMLGVAITLTLAAVYSLGNLGVVRYFWRERRSEFNIWLHAVFPAVSTAALGYVCYKSLVPLPAPPVGAAPWIALGMLVSGVIVVFAISATGREEWLRKAGAVYEGDIPQPAAAVGEPPGGPSPAGPSGEVG